MNKEELNIRINMCKFCIQTLENECKDDPRQPDALIYYQGQLAQLEAMMAQTFMDILPKPSDIVIGLKPARLFGKSLK